MTTIRDVSVAKRPEAPVEFTQEYLQLVDRIGQIRKKTDPHRLDQVRRAVEEEVQLAHWGDAMPSERSRRADRL